MGLFFLSILHARIKVLETPVGGRLELKVPCGQFVTFFIPLVESGSIIWNCDQIPGPFRHALAVSE